MDYCDECHYAKDALCPKCHEQFICGDCEPECLDCYLWPDKDDDLDDDGQVE